MKEICGVCVFAFMDDFPLIQMRGGVEQSQKEAFPEGCEVVMFPVKPAGARGEERKLILNQAVNQISPKVRDGLRDHFLKTPNDSCSLLFYYFEIQSYQFPLTYGGRISSE